MQHGISHKTRKQKGKGILKPTKYKKIDSVMMVNNNAGAGTRTERNQVTLERDLHRSRLDQQGSMTHSHDQVDTALFVFFCVR